MNVHDYAVIASAINSTLDGINVESGSDEAKTKATEEVIILADHLARYFGDNNDNFNYDKFTEACGYHGSDTVDYISNPK